MSALKSSPKAAPEPPGTLHCCLCCGRDTRSKYQICAGCLNGRRSSRVRNPEDGWAPAEDDYSEESDPNSVYRESELDLDREVRR